ncbi:MAG TPA: DUF5671 domain-containing protein [Verrucomicrobiae bacterium]|jgi:hypothetical protein|nr:DUF5671 domain-containing protein [Verrucomicrobiae bacterium]
MNKLSNPTEDLSQFVASAKAHGVADDFIVTLLRRNGWGEQRVYRAFSAYYAGVLDAPLPRGAGSAENARDAFYYLLNFLTLGFWSVALGQIFYALIAHRFPDAAGAGYYGMSLRDQISWQVATVIVTFPIFAFVHRIIGRTLQTRPDSYNSGVRKWLTYLALVLAVLVICSDAIWFIEAFLRGQLTTQFILDSLVLLVIGGGIFTYYLATIDPPKSQAS